MQKSLQLEQSSSRQEQDYQNKLKTIEVELQKYMMNKQEESQKLLLQADAQLKLNED